MARTPQNLATGTLASTALTTLYTVLAKEVLSPALVLTNNSANKIDVSVFINNGSSDFLLIKKTLPSGVGKSFQVFELATQKLNATFEVKIQASTSTGINFFLSGSIIDEG